MSTKSVWPVDELMPLAEASQDVPTTRGRSRRDQEHQISVLLLEAVACLRELSEIILRHERVGFAGRGERAERSSG